MIQACKTTILGEIWSIKFGTMEKYPNLENSDGYCDSSTREIIIDDMVSGSRGMDAKKNIELYRNTVIRHEIIHAYLEESGLSQNTYMPEDGWAFNEEMVDWMAIQAPKIFRTFTELGIL